MRLPKNQSQFFKEQAFQINKKAKVFLFGSRVDDTKKGGDIDIMILCKPKLERDQIRKIKINFYKKFGDQKIDIVSYAPNEKSTFKKLISLEAIEL